MGWRRRLHGDGWRAVTLRSAAIFVSVVAVVLIVQIVGAALFRNPDETLRLPSWWLGQAATAAFGGVIGAVCYFSYVMHRPRIGICPRCRYSLQGLPMEVDRCPECGSLLVHDPKHVQRNRERR